jgi:hypothetical protein
LYTQGIDPKYASALTNLLLTVKTYVSYKERGAEQSAESINKDIEKDIDAANTMSLEVNTKRDPGLEKVTIVSNYSLVKKWGSEGKEDGQFYMPYGVVVDFSGNVYVAVKRLLVI